jgi:[ribosomal protein S5]-alanine N-acetyltransferase
MALARDPSRPHVALRAATPRDADQLRRWRAEPTVRRFQPLNDLSTAQLRSDVAAQRIADLYRGRGEKYQWIVEVDGDAAGWVTLVISNWEHGLAEVGYALATAFQGRGLMCPALDALLADLFCHTSIERVEARCAVDNHASRRVLEKCGFTQEGRLRSYFRLHGRRIDNLLYAVLREEWGRAGPVDRR